MDNSETRDRSLQAANALDDFLARHPLASGTCTLSTLENSSSADDVSSVDHALS